MSKTTFALSIDQDNTMEILSMEFLRDKRGNDTLELDVDNDVYLDQENRFEFFRKNQISKKYVDEYIIYELNHALSAYPGMKSVNPEKFKKGDFSFDVSKSKDNRLVFKSKKSVADKFWSEYFPKDGYKNGEMFVDLMKT